MENLLDRARGSENISNEKDKVMERIDWLNHLRMIYNITAGIASVRSIPNTITTEAFLNTLLDNIFRLPLQNRDIYKKSSSVQCMSFDDVFTCFETDFGKHLTWDYVMNQIILLSLKTNSFEDEILPESPKSLDLNELVYISRFSNSSPEYEDTEQRPPRVGDLRIPQTPRGLRSDTGFQNSFHNREISSGSRISHDLTPSNGRPPLKLPDFHESIQKIEDEKMIAFSEPKEENSVEEPQNRVLDLSGKKLTSFRNGLTTSIIILSLSNNRITKIPSFPSTNALESVDLSWNMIENVQNLGVLKNLKELYLSHNLISKISTLSQNECLALLDLSHNKIIQFQCFAALAQNKRLRVLCVTGNKIVKNKDFKRNIEALLPQIIILNPENVMDHSVVSSDPKASVRSSIQLGEKPRISMRHSAENPFKLINKKAK